MSDLTVFETPVLKLVAIGSIDDAKKQKIKSILSLFSGLVLLEKALSGIGELKLPNEPLCTIDWYRQRKKEERGSTIFVEMWEAPSFPSIKHNDATLRNSEMKGAKFEKKKNYKKMQTQKNYKKGTPKHKQRTHHGCKTTSFR